MQVICTLALHHPLTAVSHEITLRYVEQMQHSSLSCFAVGHTSLYALPVIVVYSMCNCSIQYVIAS